MKLAVIDQIICDFYECSDEKQSTDRKLGNAEGALGAIFSVINVEYENKGEARQ